MLTPRRKSKNNIMEKWLSHFCICCFNELYSPATAGDHKRNRQSTLRKHEVTFFWVTWPVFPTDKVSHWGLCAGTDECPRCVWMVQCAAFPPAVCLRTPALPFSPGACSCADTWDCGFFYVSCGEQTLGHLQTIFEELMKAKQKSKLIFTRFIFIMWWPVSSLEKKSREWDISDWKNHQKLLRPHCLVWLTSKLVIKLPLILWRSPVSLFSDALRCNSLHLPGTDLL